MAPSVWELLSRTAVIVGLIRTSAAFSFTYGAASQCDEFQVSWTGEINHIHFPYQPVLNLGAKAERHLFSY
jgi:hypothetical protein